MVFLVSMCVGCSPSQQTPQVQFPLAVPHPGSRSAHLGGLLRYQLPRVTDFLVKYQSPHCQPGPNLLSKLFFFLTRICTVTGIHFFHKNELHSNQPEGLMRSWPIFPGFLLFQFWKKSALIFNSMCLGPSSQLGVNAFLQTRSALMTTFSSPGEN